MKSNIENGSYKMSTMAAILLTTVKNTAGDSLIYGI